MNPSHPFLNRGSQVDLSPTLPTYQNHTQASKLMMLQPSQKQSDQIAKTYLPERRSIMFNESIQQSDLNAADRNQQMFKLKFNERKKEAILLKQKLFTSIKNEQVKSKVLKFNTVNQKMYENQRSMND